MKDASLLSFVTNERVRYADVDKMGVVYNGNYLRFFEIGRTELMRHFGIPYSEVEKQGYLLPLIEAKIVWKGSAKYDDVLEITTLFNSKEINSTIRFDYEIRVDGKIIVNGYTVHSFVRADNFRAVKPPSFFLNKVEEIIKTKHI
ncbi:MAG: acyl-CoA thioesterase [Ignavibacteria bacterium]|nr:acyl-CoA thioesterase [Ignavibacteria bacterium]